MGVEAELAKETHEDEDTAVIVRALRALTLRENLPGIMRAVVGVIHVVEQRV